jgi:HSP20 family protein
MVSNPGFAAEIRRVFDELERGGPTAAGECVPPVDVYELENDIVVVLDLPGVPPSGVRALVKEGVLLIAGEKAPTACPVEGRKEDARFHLAERGFGRFVRAVRLPGPVDPSRARATIAGGELHIRIPRIDERRGAAIEIKIA